MSKINQSDFDFAQELPGLMPIDSHPPVANPSSGISLQERLRIAQQNAALASAEEEATTYDSEDKYNLKDGNIFSQTVDTVQSLKNEDTDFPSFFADGIQAATKGLASIIEKLPFVPSSARVAAAQTVRLFGATVTGSYLFNLGRTESGNRDDAHAGTSSAAGRFQFVEQSWLATVEAHGKDHGGALATAAERIFKGKDGKYHVQGGYSEEQQILNMRYNPAYSVPMANDYSADNAALLQEKLGRPVNATELYIGGHLLNAYGDGHKFLQGLQHNGGQDLAANYVSAAELRANTSIFGHGATCADVFNRFERKFGTDAVHLETAHSPGIQMAQRSQQLPQLG